MRGALALLYTCRASGAFKNWCALRTLQNGEGFHLDLMIEDFRTLESGLIRLSRIPFGAVLLYQVGLMNWYRSAENGNGECTVTQTAVFERNPLPEHFCVKCV